MTIQKIKISPESANYDDNVDNVAYLYRGYFIWKSENIGDRGGSYAEWSFGEARLVEPNAALGESFEPYWEDCYEIKTCQSRGDCLRIIDKLVGDASLAAEVAEDALPVTLTVTKAQARTILAALSRRCNELDILGGPDAEALSKETREIYQSVDGQVYGVKS